MTSGAPTASVISSSAVVEALNVVMPAAMSRSMAHAVFAVLTWARQRSAPPRRAIVVSMLRSTAAASMTSAGVGTPLKAGRSSERGESGAFDGLDRAIPARGRSLSDHSPAEQRAMERETRFELATFSLEG